MLLLSIQVFFAFSFLSPDPDHPKGLIPTAALTQRPPIGSKVVPCQPYVSLGACSLRIESEALEARGLQRRGSQAGTLLRVDPLWPKPSRYGGRCRRRPVDGMM